MKDSVVVTALEMSWNVEPPFVDTCHCTVGVGAPPAAAVKPAVVASHTVCDTGCVITNGPCWARSVAETLPGGRAIVPVSIDVNPEMFPSEFVKLPAAFASTEAVTVHDPPPAGRLPPVSVSVVDVPPAMPPTQVVCGVATIVMPDGSVSVNAIPETAGVPASVLMTSVSVDGVPSETTVGVKDFASAGNAATTS